MKQQNNYSDLERLELIAQRIVDNQTDITCSFGDWIEVTLACASLGEAAREAYHQICSVYPKYSREECDEKFTNCLTSSRGMVTLGTLMKMAKDAGVDISMPRGRRPQSSEQKQQEQENRMLQMRNILNAQAEWRFNTWRQRPELREQGQPWRPVQDRDLDTYYCRVKEQGLKVTAQDVKSTIFSRDFCPDFDAVKTWLDSLPAWNPDTDPDYLNNFYVGHLEFGDPENEPFYDQMLKKWHVGLVALMLGRISENPQMPVLKGQQHIGKTFVARHLLPPELSEYRLEVGPSDRIDKDFIISLSETPLILFDEISFGSNQKNEAFKYIVTSTRSNLRDAYAHFRENRQRRASLIATTNDNCPIPNSEGTRRYLVVDLEGTVDLDAFPLPYEGAYAQALYLLNHGYNPKPTQEESQLITDHNRAYIQADDCEEAIRTFLRQPDGSGVVEAMSAGDIMHELNWRGFRGREYSAYKIGKTMKRLGFESKMLNGTTKYLVSKQDPDLHSRQNKEDANQFIPQDLRDL